MLEDFIILLDDTAVSYCHGSNHHQEPHLISEETLKRAITYAMKRNLHIQFVYPFYDVPASYKKIIQTVDHINIKPACCATSDTDVLVFDSWKDFSTYPFNDKMICVLRTCKADFYANYPIIGQVTGKIKRLNIVLTDIESFTSQDIEAYQKALEGLADLIRSAYLQGKRLQLNLLTDRIMLDAMNNCNAGWKNITLGPNGRFYLCPSYYFEDETNDAGNLQEGLKLANAQLYRLDYAPLCKTCDAYQCKRCSWMNERTTLEVHIPSHEQCVVAHLERNASRYLLEQIRRDKQILPHIEIKEITYLDPFETHKK